MTDSAVIYCRISDDPRAEQLGVERQEAECRTLAASRGWTVAKVYVDNDLSATSGVTRPEFEALLADQPPRIITWHLDRLLRVSKDLERVLDLNTNVHTIQSGDLDLSTPAGRAVARTVTAWATYEGEQKAVRQLAAHRQRVESGKPFWGLAPFGYAYEYDKAGRKIPVLEPAEAERVREAYKRVAGGETYAAISRDWTAQGVVVRGRTHGPGRPPSPDFVRRLIHSPRNAGLIIYHGEIVGEGDWPAIVNREQWEAIVHVAGRPDLKGRGQGRRQGLLTGIARCSRCGSTQRLRHRPTSKSKREDRARRYVYGSGQECGHVSAPREWLDAFVRNAILRRLTGPGAILRREREIRQSQGGAEALRRSRELRARLEELADAFADGDITKEQLSRGSSKLKEELAGLDRQVQRHLRPDPLMQMSYSGPAQMLAAWEDDSLELEARRVLVKRLLVEVTLHPRPKGKRMSEDFVEIIWRDS